MADGSALGVVALAEIGPISYADAPVTDAAVPEVLDVIRVAGVEVLVADASVADASE